MQYDIILITGEMFFDHPLCGPAILKRLLEKKGYSVAVIEMPKSASALRRYGAPKLFYGVTSGSIDSMVRNYTPLKKKRIEDIHLDYCEEVPDRAVIVYCNWIKQLFKKVPIVLGGTEASLRRFTHYDYWDNKLRRSILFDTRADILVYGSGEKQILEIAKRLKSKNDLNGVEGTCVLSKEVPKGFVELPSHEEVSKSKEKFCDMQMLLNNYSDLSQECNKWNVLQYKSPVYTSKDLDSYYELEFSRDVPRELRGFEFSVVTHRGCVGNCNFCALRLLQGARIVSRTEKSILKEISRIAKMANFKGKIDDLGGPSANMYGMDCNKCGKDCIDCPVLDRSNKRLISLLKKARKVKGVRHVYIRSGIRYDLASPAYLKEVMEHHIFDTLRIAPEHVNKKVLKLMNKDKGDLDKFVKKYRGKLSFYFMTAHPGSSMKEAKQLADSIKRLGNVEGLQVFTPTPMTVSTCMYYTGMDPRTKKEVYVPYTYREKKEQKRLVLGHLKKKPRDEDAECTGS